MPMQLAIIQLFLQKPRVFSSRAYRDEMKEGMSLDLQKTIFVFVASARDIKIIVFLVMCKQILESKGHGVQDLHSDQLPRC